MKRVIISSVIAILILILLIGVFIKGVNEPPQYYDKVVIDIRNQSSKAIQDAYMKVEKTETFIIPNGETYCDEEIGIPKIAPKSRVVVVLDQSNVAVPGMKLRLKCNEYNDLIVDKLHNGTGSVHIVTIKKDYSVVHEQIYNSILQKPTLFYWKKYDELVKLP